MQNFLKPEMLIKINGNNCKYSILDKGNMGCNGKEFVHTQQKQVLIL